VSCLALVAVLLFSGAPARAASFVLPPLGEAVVGRLQYVASASEDTLPDIARRYDLGYDEIIRANPEVNRWLPGEGSRVLLPTRYILPDAPREGIVLNVAEQRLYYYPEVPSSAGGPARVVIYPVSIGRIDWETPVMLTHVVEKVIDPVWFPPESIRAEHVADGHPLPDRILSGPDNPLGRYALRLDAPGYLIHGTNKPYGIGMRATHGCVRLYPEDIEEIFAKVPVGTPVRIVNQPFKAGWESGALYLEVHPSHKGSSLDLTSMVRAIVEATRDQSSALVDWQKALRIAESGQGIPLPITLDALDGAGQGFPHRSN
jgi:L,D-transpeptidase ErfK/SrfK